MLANSRIPFANLNRRAWANLGITALAAMVMLFVLFHFALNKPFEYIGVDFPSFYSSAKIVREHGFAAVYDQSLQKEYQDQIYLSQFGVAYPYGVNPTPLLPFFVLLLVPLSYLDPLPAFYVWTALDALFLAGYLWFLAKDAHQDRVPLVVGLLLTLPVIFTLLFGQVEVWLAIFIGELYRAFRSGKQARSGAWMAMALLKPQILVLLLPGLVIARQQRAIAGFVLASAAILVISTILAGTPGMIALAELLVGYAQPHGLATNAPALMMNWRGLAVNLELLSGNVNLAWIFASLGMVATGVGGLALWFSRSDESDYARPELWLGALAATFALTWHSHVHMALPFVIIASFAWRELRRFPLPVAAWLFSPTILFIVVAFGLGTSNAHAVLGIFVLGLNLWVLIWAWRRQPAVLSSATRSHISLTPA